MSPYELKILLHIYCCGGEFEFEDSDLRKSTLTRFVDCGVIIESDVYEHGYYVTDLGKAWVCAILETEIPKTRYFNQSGDIIKF